MKFWLDPTLDPYLKNTDPKHWFLETNVGNLAYSFLKLAAKLQKKHPFVVVTTAIHVTDSPYYDQELEYIIQFNNYLKIGSLNLQLGLLELDDMNIYSYKTKDNLIYYRSTPKFTRTLFDYNGTPTDAGQNEIRQKIEHFEKDKIVLQTEINK